MTELLHHWFIRLIQAHALQLRNLSNPANDNFNWDNYRQ